MDSTPIFNTKTINFLKAIHFKKMYVLALTKRLNLIRQGFSSKTEYEKNEIEIIEFQTRFAIYSANSTINEMEGHFRVQLTTNFNELKTNKDEE